MEIQHGVTMNTYFQAELILQQDKILQALLISQNVAWYGVAFLSSTIFST
jgi:hypothetical protein